MPVSPRDFELYSRMTGTPMPSDAMSRMQMAPAVYDFTRNFAKKPNLLEKTGNLAKTVGKIGLMGLGQGFKQSQANEQRGIQEQLRTQAEARQAEALVTGDSNVERQQTPAEIIEDKRLARLERTAQIKKEERDDKQSKALELLQAKKQEIVATPEIEEEVQQTTTADNYQQDFVPNQTSSGLIDRKMEQGSQIADETPNVAEVLSESQDSRQSEFSDPEDVQKQMESDMIGGGLGKNQLSKFLKQKGLDQVLIGAVGERTAQEPLIGDDSPLLDHPDVIGGEDDANLPSGMNTGATQNLSSFYKEMRKMDAQERLKDASPSDKQVNLLEQRAIDNQEAIDSGFMNLDDEGRKKESIRLGSTGGIPNKTDMAEIKKDPEFIAAQESMKPKSTAEKTDDFTAKFVEGARSDIVMGARGNKSLGITRIPATNGDAQVGFVLANKPLDQSPKFATTYGFGVAPGAESLLDNQLNKDSFSDYMKRGMSEAKQGKKRKAGEIFEYLPQSARVVGGTASLGDIVM